MTFLSLKQKTVSVPENLKMKKEQIFTVKHPHRFSVLTVAATTNEFNFQTMFDKNVLVYAWADKKIMWQIFDHLLGWVWYVLCLALALEESIDIRNRVNWCVSNSVIFMIIMVVFRTQMAACCTELESVWRTVALHRQSVPRLDKDTQECTTWCGSRECRFCCRS